MSVINFALQVTVPEAYLGPVLSDLSSLRRAQVQEVKESVSESGRVVYSQELRVVSALVPLATLLVSEPGVCVECVCERGEEFLLWA